VQDAVLDVERGLARQADRVAALSDLLRHDRLEWIPGSEGGQDDGWLTLSVPARLLRLAYLSPEITRAIVHGRQPVDFSAAELLRATRLPLAWQAQNAALGFDTV
jgi:hypothetical protein